MPKSKKDDSSSDSGPEDRNPPPAKKSKAAAPAKPKEKQANESSGTRWTLEKMRMVNINEFRGRKMVDIREFYEKNGEVLPGKKGISLSALQWRKLLEIAEEVTAALEDQ